MKATEGNERLEASSQGELERPVVLRLRRTPVREERRRLLEESGRRAHDHLRSLQHEDGHYCGELEGCTILESEYVLLLQFLGRGGEERARRAGAFIRASQEAHGGWGIFPGGPTDVSTSVKAYFVLKLLGDDPATPHMTRARDAILKAGGVEAVNSFTKVQLAIFGQYPWERCPAVPPEMVLLPSWSYVSIHAMSSWSRLILVPLSVIWATKPRCEIPARAQIQELRCEEPWKAPAPASLNERLWHRFFRGLDRVLKTVESRRLTPLRRRALARAEGWMLERMDLSDGLGAIFPATANGVFALRCLGYAPDHPRVIEELRALERLEIEDFETKTLRLQPCRGPAWDTALALRALLEQEPQGDAGQRRAVRWLLDREVTHVGDWRSRNPEGRPGGWTFQYQATRYPDCDDTAQVLQCLARIRLSDPQDARRATAARDRGVAWLMSMQNRDGGWGAFDKNCDRRILTYVPFADHNAMIDPSCEDITGRILEAFAAAGVHPSHPAVRKAVTFLRSRQEPDGTWYGRWGCNYIYGTYLALSGLAASSEEMTRPRYQRAADWLREKQNADGGWGESLASYERPDCKGEGESTAAQTAWALLALFACGDFDSNTVQGGLDYLLASQEPGGGFRDGPWTGTGFPKVFYLRYELYDRYFPLLALSTYRNRTSSGRELQT